MVNCNVLKLLRVLDHRTCTCRACSGPLQLSVDSLVRSGGVGDRVVIRTGSSQCIAEGYSVVPQWYGFSRGVMKAVWGKSRLSQTRSSSEVELMKMSWGPLVIGKIGIPPGRPLVDCSPVGELSGPVVPKLSRTRYLASSAAEGGFRSGWGVAPADE